MVAPGDLVHRVLGRQPGADVEELIDPFLAHQVHGPAQEAAVDAGPHASFGDGGQQLLGRFAVGGIVVLTTQVVVVEAGGAGHARVDARGHARIGGGGGLVHGGDRESVV